MRITVAQVEELAGPTRGWPGYCTAVAKQVVNAGLVEGVVVYGMWCGTIEPGTHFYPRPFTHHSWIILPNGRILDPTRWVFEGAEPYVYVGDGDDPDYDEGGNDLHEAFLDRPPPEYDAKAERCPLGLTGAAGTRVLELVGGDAPSNLTEAQVFWLANVHYDRLKPYALEIYRAIAKAGLRAAIPFDNLERAEAGR